MEDDVEADSKVMARNKTRHGRLAPVVMTALLVIVVLSGCIASGEEVVQIGALLPLTGDGASFGEPALNGVKMAISEFNGQGGLDGAEAILVQGDTQFPRTQEAVSEAERLIGEGVPVIIGATASDSTAAAKERTNDAGVVLISPGSTRPSLTGPHHGTFFRVIANDTVQGPQSARYVYEDFGTEEVVVMYEQTAYGRGLEQEFVKAYEELGGTVVGPSIAWEHDETVYAAKAAEAAGRVTDFIWIAGQAPHIASLVEAIRDQGFEGRIQTTEAIENPAIFDVAADAVDGVVFTKSGLGLGSDRAQAFNDDYEQTFGEGPGVYSAFAYDAAWVAFEAMEAVGTDPADIAAWMEDNSVNGRVTTDTIRFNANGDVTTGGYGLWVVDSEESGFKPYEG